MNSSASYPKFEDYCLPIRTTSPSLKPVSATDDDLKGDNHLPRVMYPTTFPLPTSGQEEDLPVLEIDRRLVSSALLRKIERELKYDSLDPRTVFNFCRGLERGSLEFQEAYISARIRTPSRHYRDATHSLLGTDSNAVGNSLNSFRHGVEDKNASAWHPMAVNHLGHLMSHFGIWVIGLLGVQILAAWRISAFAHIYLEGGRYFYLAVAMFVMLLLDSVVWFQRRGNLCNAFLVPGAVLYLVTLLPIMILHVRQAMQTIE